LEENYYSCANEYTIQTISNHKDPFSLKRYIKKKTLEDVAREYLNGNGVKSGYKKIIFSGVCLSILHYATFFHCFDDCPIFDYIPIQ